MKVFLQRLLASFSRRIIAKYKPKIVGITGSVGKTSAKEAVFLVVSQTFKARKSEKNFNNEFGVPFTVLGVDSPGRSPVKWLGVILKAVSLVLFTHKYPQVLVLEMGIDRPGVRCDTDCHQTVRGRWRKNQTRVCRCHYERHESADNQHKVGLIWHTKRQDGTQDG
jgi:hypothetical protein